MLFRSNHCKAVASKAVDLANQLTQKGFALNIDLIERAALLHDLYRLEDKHAVVAAEFLRKVECDQVADVVEAHMSIDELMAETIDEQSLVFIADKLIREDQPVTIVQRYEKALQESINDIQRHNRVAYAQQLAQQLVNGISAQLGYNIEEK